MHVLGTMMLQFGCRYVMCGGACASSLSHMSAGSGNTAPSFAIHHQLRIKFLGSLVPSSSRF